MKVVPFQKYTNRSQDLCITVPNFTQWLDGLPFVVFCVRHASIAGALGLGGPDVYTCDENGRVYKNREDPYDLIKGEEDCLKCGLQSAHTEGGK